jgi:AcrR family transcriptional regulator
VTASTKRALVIEAAVLLFSRHGFRKTSIDQIAAQAQVAKPTVYAYFDDKEALFVAVCEHLCETIFAEAELAKDAGGDLAERIARMLSAKFTRVFELVGSSPHAEELLQASRNDRARQVVERADERFAALLGGEIRGAAKRRELDLAALGVSPAELVRALHQAAHGASYGATSADEHRKSIERLTRLVLGAGLP